MIYLFSKRTLIFPSVIAVTALFLSGCGNKPRKETPTETMTEQYRSELLRAAENDRQRYAVAKLNEESKQKVEMYRKEAGTRNAEKIKSLGFSPAFLRSTIYASAFGQWGEFMPATQWLGLLLENKTISSISAFSESGHPGVLVKNAGSPALGIVFRLEGNEAYPYALTGNGQTGVISPSNQMEVTFLMGKYTKDTSK